jgi:hypothetical protein
MVQAFPTSRAQALVDLSVQLTDLGRLESISPDSAPEIGKVMRNQAPCYGLTRSWSILSETAQKVDYLLDKVNYSNGRCKGEGRLKVIPRKIREICGLHKAGPVGDCRDPFQTLRAAEESSPPGSKDSLRWARPYSHRVIINALCLPREQSPLDRGRDFYSTGDAPSNHLK